MCRGTWPSSLVALGLAPYCSNSLTHSGWHSSQASCRAVVPPGARSTRAPRIRRCRRHSVKPRPAVMCSGVVSSCSYVRDHSPEKKNRVVRLFEDSDNISILQLVWSFISFSIRKSWTGLDSLRYFSWVCVHGIQWAGKICFFCAFFYLDLMCPFIYLLFKLNIFFKARSKPYVVVFHYSGCSVTNVILKVQ